MRLNLEHLETRLVPATFNAVDVPSLIADIKTANGNGVANTINLTAPTGLYVLTAANNSTDGPTGLPVITTSHLLTINGNHARIERSSVSGTPAFRLLDVASGAALMLKNVTLQNGLATGNSVTPAEGGAIFNKGALTLNAVSLLSNVAHGTNGSTFLLPNGQDGAGGGIWSSGGSLTLTGGALLQNDGAFGGNGIATGGNAFGGGIYANLTKVSIGAGTIVESCTAVGGFGGSLGGPGGNASGGGLYATGSSTLLESVSVTGTTFQADRVNNFFAAGGGHLASGGVGSGGGVAVNDASLILSGDHFQYNFAGGGFGGYGETSNQSGATGGNAYGGGLYASGGSLTESSFLVVQGNGAEGGQGGSGGFGKSGATGGTGGNAYGGGICTVGTAVRMTVAPTLQGNFSAGGSGGRGGSASVAGNHHGNGGNGGDGRGGALYAAASGAINLVLENATLENNYAYGGSGNDGGIAHNYVGAGNGGNGGNAYGGALYLAQNATLLYDTIGQPQTTFPLFSNQAFGGNGGTGYSISGRAGNAGNASGGALYVQSGTISLGSSSVENNVAQGGTGGFARNYNPTLAFLGFTGQGGAGYGGGLYVGGGTLAVKNCTLDYNVAEGGNGGYHQLFVAGTTTTGPHWQFTGGTPGERGGGGSASGGGLYNNGGTLHLTSDDIEFNQADGGYTELFGVRSTGDGGGLYKAAGTTVLAFTTISNNTANGSANDIRP